MKILEFDTKYLNGYKIVGEDVVKNYLNDIREEYVMLKILDNILNSCKDENENIDYTFRDKILKGMTINSENETKYDLSKDIINQVSKNERFIRPLLDIVSENNFPKKDIKVLEINLSNAIMATEAEQHLACAQIYPINVDYTIAHNSIENLHKDYKNKSFKLIEWDLKEDSFPSGITTVDLIIYRDSQELWDLKLDNYLQEIYDKISNKGFLLTVFRNKFSTPELVLNKLFKNNFINESNLAKRMNDFMIEAQKIGLNIICLKSDSIGSIAILFRKVIPMESIRLEDNVIIEVNDNYEKWLDVLRENFKKNILDKEIHNKESYIWLIANDSSINGILGLVNSLRQEPGGERIKCIFDFDKKYKFPINFEEKPFSDILVNDLGINVIRDGKLGTYRHLSLPKNYDKVESNDYYLNVGPNGDLSSLQWFESKNIKPNETHINVDNRKIPQIRCNIYSTGLNFRDVMLASGIYIVSFSNKINFLVK
jgi:fatty acid synthase